MTVSRREEIPPRGFPVEEFETRTARAQKLLREQALDALLIMTEPEFAYFTGFNSYFWQSPTRPWFLVIPAKGKPVAIIPGIGENAVSQSWLDDIRVWTSPNPEDEGISLLAATLRELAPRHRRVGVPMGPETHLRMPVNDFQALRSGLSELEIVDATSIVRDLRMVKSEREIAKLAHICSIVSDAYDNVPNIIRAGMSEREARNAFRIDVLSRGVDSAPYIVTTSARGGVDDAIRFPSERLLSDGDVVFVDTGAEIDGYYSDFDRNFAIGSASRETRSAYDLVYRATGSGIAAAVPGARMSDVWLAMAEVLASGGATGGSVGRMGHGVGLRNTEWPSVMKTDKTIIRPGMVLAIEPGFEFAPGKIMLHEENIVVREDGPQLISRRAAPELPVIR
ncbi:MAG: Xaa-Pro peptidase family protein [Roseibium sp.]|uniref:M24 family metallopeptidase n=1 Tax=Roseibium sp. TaxID=1936156 RepID=UPI002618EDD5|nr:Xaa-Pro peptidase family protein [Roseibium sp.]MCV0425642.1 Xaa-Pro peptidase family protein [Roseibium sp.]